MSRFLGLAAVAIGLVGYFPYLWGMYRGEVRPHAFTWLLWGILTGIAYAAQVSDHAGAGSWATGATALICLGIAGAAWRQSRLSNVAPVDWYFFLAALAAIPLWLVTRAPVYSSHYSHRCSGLCPDLSKILVPSGAGGSFYVRHQHSKVPSRPRRVAPTDDGQQPLSLVARRHQRAFHRDGAISPPGSFGVSVRGVSLASAIDRGSAC